MHALCLVMEQAPMFSKPTTEWGHLFMVEESWFPRTGQPSLLCKAAFAVQHESWAAVGDERPGKKPKGEEEGWSKKRGPEDE